MKSIVYIGLTVLAVFMAWYFYRKYRVAPDLDLSRLPLYTLDGATASINPGKDKMTIVCFGASWCPACITELKSLKANPDATGNARIIVVSDEDASKISAFRSRMEVPYTFLRLNGAFSDIGIHSIPVTFILDNNGRIINKVVGAIDWSQRSQTARLLAE